MVDHCWDRDTDTDTDTDTMILSTKALLLQTPTTPPSPNCEFGNSKNPYDYMPQAPAGRRGFGTADITVTTTDDVVVSKKLLSKRLFLDLDDHFVPLFLAPRRSSNISSSSISISSNKKVKTMPAFFSENNDVSPLSLIHASLIRMCDGKSLQRLTEERESTAAAAAGTTAAATAVAANDNTVGTVQVDTPNIYMNGSTTTTTTTENGEDDDDDEDDEEQQRIASAISSWKQRLLLVKGKESTTTKTSIPSGGVTLGKGVQRRDSGIARCA